MDALLNPRAVAGDNRPPLAEQLASDYSGLAERAEEAVGLVPDALRPIQTDEEADAYTETAKTIKGVIRDADAAFTQEKEPWLEGGRTVEAFFGFRATLKAKAAKAVAAVNTWQTAKLAAQRKADAEAAEKARREAALFDEPAPVIAPTIVKEVARVVTATGTKATASTYWKAEVTDLEQVPLKYLMVNQMALDMAVKGAAGLRKIPGVRIYEAVRTSIR